VNGGPPQHRQDRDPAGSRARAAAWCTAAGIVLGVAAIICLGLHAIVVQQAIAMALPAALLVVGGVIWGASPDAAASRRLGAHTGFRLGWLVTRLRSLFRRRGNGGQ
jgi:hypothetical protein